MLTDPNIDVNSEEYKELKFKYLTQQNRELLKEVNWMREYVGKRGKDLYKIALLEASKKEREESRKKVTPQLPIPIKTTLAEIKKATKKRGSQFKQAKYLAELLKAKEFDTLEGFKITGFFAYWSIELGHKNEEALGKAYYKVIKIYENLMFIA